MPVCGIARSCSKDWGYPRRPNSVTRAGVPEAHTPRDVSHSDMPPRFAYWTILIDDGPTAFRARDAQDLLPTLNQLKRRNSNVVMKWFSGGRLWESPEAAERARRRPAARPEKRRADWRPGGAHTDPRDRFRRTRERRPPKRTRR